LSKRLWGSELAFVSRGRVCPNPDDEGGIARGGLLWHGSQPVAKRRVRQKRSVRLASVYERGLAVTWFETLRLDSSRLAEGGSNGVTRPEF
jgi:hypothetical protein